MARLRFPGRPGCRFDRLGVHYGADEARNVNDPLTLFVANIHRGLRMFRELVGDSDEVIPNFSCASTQNGRHRSYLTIMILFFCLFCINLNFLRVYI